VRTRALAVVVTDMFAVLFALAVMKVVGRGEDLVVLVELEVVGFADLLE
jgi:hypothetical protein